MTLQEFRSQNDDLYPAAVEWILEGWGYSGGESDITALMFAAALQKEADFQDGCVARGESDASFPLRLRRLACELAKTAISEMSVTASTVQHEDRRTRSTTCPTQIAVGDRIELMEMHDDPDAIPPGTQGMVDFVNELLEFTQVSVRWDNGRSLMLCVPPDRYKKVK